MDIFLNVADDSVYKNLKEWWAREESPGNEGPCTNEIKQEILEQDILHPVHIKKVKPEFVSIKDIKTEEQDINQCPDHHMAMKSEEVNIKSDHEDDSEELEEQDINQCLDHHVKIESKEVDIKCDCEDNRCCKCDFLSMDNFDSEKLVSEVYLRPAIWDLRTLEYTDRAKKKRAWEEVTDAFVDEDSTKEEKRKIGTRLQRKWKNIRDQYTKELKDKTGRPVQVKEGKKTPYMYAKQLTFLSDMIQSRPMETLIGTNSLFWTNKTGAAPTTATKRSADFTEDDQISKKRKISTTRQIERKLIEFLDNHIARQKQETSKESHHEDNDKLYLLSLLPFIKSVPPHFKFAVRMDIMRIINKYTIVQPVQVAGTQSALHQLGVGKNPVRHEEPLPGPSGDSPED